MNSFIQFQCGLSAGGVRITPPLATVSVEPSLLILKAPFLYYSFKPNQIVSLEVISKREVLVSHTVGSYPAYIKLKVQKDSQQILEEIYSCGFLPSAKSYNRVSVEGWAVRSWVVVAFLSIWFGTIWAGRRYPELSIVAPLPVITLLSFCCASIVLLSSYDMQKLILKPSRNINEIKPALCLLILLSGFMASLIMISVLFVPERLLKTPRKCEAIVLQQRAWWCPERFNR